MLSKTKIKTDHVVELIIHAYAFSRYFYAKQPRVHILLTVYTHDLAIAMLFE